MKGIILASHGHLAEGMLDTLQMFCGDIPQIETICLLPEEDVLEYTEKLKTAAKHIDTGDGVVIFCDLLFGSPCNCSARLLKEEKDWKLHVITGMNLAMVLEFVNARESGMENSALVYTGQQGIVDFNKLLASREA